MKIALVGAELEENLAIRYIWSSLEKAGHEVVQIVFNHEEDIEQAAREMTQSGAELAGFSMVFTYRASEFTQLAARSRQLGFSGHMCAGGHFAAFNAERLLLEETALDSIVCGEGEPIMLDLAANLTDLSSVQGLVWRDHKGGIRRNKPAIKPPDLDALPPPVHKDPFDRFLGLPIVNLLSSRGCTHNCVFCSIAAWHRICGGARLRQRCVSQVADEICQLYSQGARLFNFHDDNFFSSTREESFTRFHLLKNELQHRQIGRIAFAIKARPDDVDNEIFRFLKGMGLFRVFLGIEAGTSESLSRLGRGQTLADNDRAIKVVNGLDIHACFNLLLLNPDSTLEDIEANIRFLRAHPRNPMNFCRTEIYSGTPLETKLRREGRLLGTYWGFNYTIADPRAQRVFDLIYMGFAGRSLGETCIHHTTMAVDYERQILDHFFGCPRLLGQKVKQFIVDVNLNTCGYLTELIQAADSGFTRMHQRDLFLTDLRRRLTTDNERFQMKGAELIRLIRGRAEDKRAPSYTSRIMRSAAAKTALLASVAITSAQAGCYHTEMAPRPPATQVLREHQELKERLLPLVARRLDKPVGVSIRVSVDTDRRSIRSCTFRIYPGPSFAVLEAWGIVLPEPLPEEMISDQFSEEEVAAALKAKGIAPPPEAEITAAPRERLIVQQALSSIIGPGDIRIVLWFGQRGVLAEILDTHNF